MRNGIIIALLAAATAPAGAQTVQDVEPVITEVEKCIAPGLPSNWEAAEVTVELPSPGASGGRAGYLVRRSLSGGVYEPFIPCDHNKPAAALVDGIRKLQPEARRNWTRVRLLLHRDGKFDLSFDYPKQ